MEKFLAVLPERPQPPSVRYGWTALIMIISCLAQLGVGRYAGFSGFFLLLPGIFAAGLLFDRGSAFFATAIGAMLAWYLFTPSIHDPRTLLPLGLFLITGMLFAVVSEGLRANWRNRFPVMPVKATGRRGAWYTPTALTTATTVANGYPEEYQEIRCFDPERRRAPLDSFRPGSTAIAPMLASALSRIVHCRCR
jgi:Domain of unknown function (DUF4118)